MSHTLTPPLHRRAATSAAAVTAPADAARQRILDAAERLLGRYGYRKMTVDDLAAEAGIGKGTVYLSFRSKEDAVLATVDRIVDAVCGEMKRVAKTKTAAPERLRRMLRARVLVRFDRVAHYRASLADLLDAVRPGLLARRARHFAREAAILEAVIRQGLEDGELVAVPPARTARALVQATNHFLPYALSPEELGDRRSLQRDADGVITLLVAALSPVHTRRRAVRATAQTAPS